MNTKLTLRIDKTLVNKAKRQAHRRGKSVSGMFSEYVKMLDDSPSDGQSQGLPPITASLFGLLRGKTLTREDYRQHLKEKHS